MGIINFILLLTKVLFLIAGLSFIWCLHEADRKLREKAESLGIDLNDLKPKHYPELPAMSKVKFNPGWNHKVACSLGNNDGWEG